MHTLLLYTVSLLPVMLFILALVWLDSFSLMKKRYLAGAFAWGGISVVAAYLWSQPVTQTLYVPSLLAAPIFEEVFKGLFVLMLIKTQRSVFFIDSLLYGAATGAGFAFFENLEYIHFIPNMTVGTAVVRGLGTAVMHCGTVAGTAAMLNWGTLRTHHTLRFYLPALLPGIALHTLYNSLIMPPFLSLLVVVVGVFAWIIALIFHNEKSIGRWLDMEMFSEVELLGAMQKGMFSHSRAGQYILSVRRQFSAERFLDMYCYVRLYLELSILSKRNLMLAEVGIEPPVDDETEGKLTEFYALRKQIGRTGESALTPIVKQDRLLRWKLEAVKSHETKKETTSSVESRPSWIDRIFVPAMWLLSIAITMLATVLWMELSRKADARRADEQLQQRIQTSVLNSHRYFLDHTLPSDYTIGTNADSAIIESCLKVIQNLEETATLAPNAAIRDSARALQARYLARLPMLTGSVRSMNLRTGDIIVRHNNGLHSDLFRKLSGGERKYSHVGIIEASAADTIRVYNSVADDYTGLGGIFAQPIYDFMPRGNFDVAVYRLDLPLDKCQAIIDEVKRLQRLGVPFDSMFDAADTTKLYCAEMVAYAVNNALHRPLIRPTGTLLGRTIYTIEDCYRLPQATCIYRRDGAPIINNY